MIIELVSSGGRWVLPAVLTQDITTALDRTIDLQNWQLISAFLLPLVMAVIIRSTWNRTAQAVATFVVAALVTIIKLALEGGLDTLSPATLVSSSLVVFALTIPFYYGLWKPTGVAPALEAATN